MLQYLSPKKLDTACSDRGGIAINAYLMNWLQIDVVVLTKVHLPHCGVQQLPWVEAPTPLRLRFHRLCVPRQVEEMHEFLRISVSRVSSESQLLSGFDLVQCYSGSPLRDCLGKRRIAGRDYASTSSCSSQWERQYLVKVASSRPTISSYGVHFTKRTAINIHPSQGRHNFPLSTE